MPSNLILLQGLTRLRRLHKRGMPSFTPHVDAATRPAVPTEQIRHNHESATVEEQHGSDSIVWVADLKRQSQAPWPSLYMTWPNLAMNSLWRASATPVSGCSGNGNLRRRCSH